MIPGSASPHLLAADAAGGGAYQVSRSLRFNPADTPTLSRTFGTPTAQGIFTFSCWLKRCNIDVVHRIFGTSVSTSGLQFNVNNPLGIQVAGSGSGASSALFRDTTAWQHVVWTQNGTSHVIYVNNVSVSSFTVAQTFVNSAVAHQIGAHGSGQHFDGYLAEIHFIDGQALAPNNFAETDAITGQWIPKLYTGAYGNNGFKLTFADNSAATSAALGKDAVGSNDWTPTNLSVTAGAGNDSLVDTPTSYGTDTGVGGEVRGNYCTLSTLSNVASGTLTNGSLDVATPSAKIPVAATLAVASGKWYWEITPTVITTGVAWIGIAPPNSLPTNDNLGSDATSYAYGSTGSKRNNNVNSAYGATYTVNDVIGVALDLDAGTLVFYKNGVSQGTAFSGLSGSFTPALADDTGSAQSVTATCNFGQRPFAYAAPSGFKVLCDTNFPEPIIAKPSIYQSIVLYTGTGASLTPTSSLAFGPGLVWIKSRGPASADHAVYDIVRGATADLATNQSAIETTQAQGLTAFNSNGFTVGTLAKLNTNLATYVAWCWDAGSSTVTNTTGTIQSSVRANVSAGISVLTYTGTGTAGNIGHGLGVAPQFVIIKKRTVTGDDWHVWHTSIGSTSYMRLNMSNNAPTVNSLVFSGAPSSTIINIGSAPTVNQSTATYVAYCFAPVTGYSAFGTYNGNAQANGTFVHLGFRPGWLLIKCIEGGIGNQDWQIFDSARPGYSVNTRLRPNTTDNETSTDLVDLTSTGFKLKANSNVTNGNGAYIYVAFAESPFKYSRAR